MHSWECFTLSTSVEVNRIAWSVEIAGESNMPGFSYLSKRSLGQEFPRPQGIHVDLQNGYVLVIT
jgi:hypothetical protein